MKLFMLFVLTIFVIFIMDMVWLGFVAKHIYAENIGGLLRRSGAAMTPIWWAAGLVYICIAVGILVFVLPQAQGHYLLALGLGAVLGLVIYGTYDFTNYSILANWPWKITLIDFIWGIVLCACGSVAATFIKTSL